MVANQNLGRVNKIQPVLFQTKQTLFFVPFEHGVSSWLVFQIPVRALFVSSVWFTFLNIALFPAPHTECNYVM